MNSLPGSKGKDYCDTCRNSFECFLEAGYICQVSFVYVIVTNHVNWHRENLRSDREKTGNFEVQFEWAPCSILSKSCFLICKDSVLLANR